MLRELGGRMWDFAVRASVRLKIAGIPAALVLIVGISIGLAVRVNTARELRSDLDERGSAIARETAGNAADLVLTNDIYGLARLARRTVESNPDVRYVLVLDRAGNPLVDTFPNGIPPRLLGASRGHEADLSTNEGTVHDIRASALGGDAGYVRIGMSERSLIASVDSMTILVLEVTGGVLLLAIASGFLLAGLIARPIGELVEATEAVGRGDFSHRVGHWAPDEIGRLAQGFDAMVERLAVSNRALLRRHQEVASLNAIGAAAGRSLELPDVCAAAVETAVAALEADAGWIFVTDADGEVEFSHETGRHGCLGRGPNTGCACDQVLSARRPLVTLAEGSCAQLGDPTEDGVPLAWLACIPLVADGAPVGAMGLAFSEEPPLVGGEEFLQAIGAQIGAAVQNAKLLAEIRRREELGRTLLNRVVTAQEEERKRVARELHDEAGQSLTSLVLGLRSVEERVGQPDLRHQVTDLRDVAARTLQDLGRLAVGLRPAALDELGLVPALRDLAERQGEVAALDIDLQVVDFDARLSRDVEIVLYRVVQEAVTNVCRHAGARHVSVLLERRGSTIVAVVEDDGVGFDLAEIQAAGTERALGIFGMQERADLVGGSVTIESQPGKGTAVYVKVPVNGQ